MSDQTPEKGQDRAQPNPNPGPPLPPFDLEAYEQAIASTPDLGPTQPLESQPIVGNYTIVSHTLDTDQCIYRVIVAKPVMVPDSEGKPGEIVGYTDELDYVFDCNDERWIDSNGNRRSEDEIASEQTDIITEALRDRMRAAQVIMAKAADPPKQLPSVGKELDL